MWRSLRTQRVRCNTCERHVTGTPFYIGMKAKNTLLTKTTSLFHESLSIISLYLSWDEIGRLRRVDKTTHSNISNCVPTWRPLFDAFSVETFNAHNCAAYVRRLNVFYQESRLCRVCASPTLQGSHRNSMGVYICTSCTFFFHLWIRCSPIGCWLLLQGSSWSTGEIDPFSW